MIVFDTNIISEITNDKCHPVVWAWAARRIDKEAATTSVNLAELLTGAATLPDAKRKTELTLKIQSFVADVFGTRILDFNTEAAIAFAAVAGDLKARGRAIGFADCQIAAIALVHDCAVVTRDVQPFLDAGLRVINPWTDE
jgi:toxin FitB